PLSFDYSGDVIFESITGSYGWDEATFRFSDNNYEFVEETIINNTSSDDELPIVSGTLRNFPNPFNPSTTISFSVTQNSDFVNLEVYNIKGQKVKTFAAFPNRGLGTRSIMWNGTDQNNKPVSSGIYLYQLKVDGKTVANKKMLLMK
ncbi:MAG: T9SS type A sorting domain-containing protein, partial [FCB group bacterium]|nr:T9SS type A sorting domain-containing protein [FCB group bacterium]